MDFNIYPLGDAAITIDFGNSIERKINDQIIAMCQYWQQQNFYGVTDIVPAYSSLTLVYNPALIRVHYNVSSAYSFLKDELTNSLKKSGRVKIPRKAVKEIPVCYHDSLAPDLKFLSEEKKISIDEVIDLHTDKTYRVFMMGFLPGFAYMGKVHKRIALPRKPTPEVKVYKGSVGIAGEQTGVYPFDSPGGWNIIGRTPIKLFDAGKENPVLLEMGDRVKFHPITLKEFNQLKT